MLNKNNLSVLLTVVVMVLFSACSAKELSPEQFKMKIDENPISEKLELAVGDVVYIDTELNNGKRVNEYSITELLSSDVIAASMIDSKIMIEANSKGTHNLTFNVRAKGHAPTEITVPINVSYPQLKLSLEDITPKPDFGESPDTVTINGGSVPIETLDKDVLDAILKEREQKLASSPKLTNNKLKMSIGTTANISLKTEPNTTFTVSNNDETICKAVVEGNTLNISGLTQGQSKLKIKAEKESFEPTEITVEVDVTLHPIGLSFTSSQTDMLKPVAEMGRPLIINAVANPSNASIKVSSDNSNVTTSVNKGVITVTPQKIGKSEITVTASKDGFQEEVVSFMLDITPSKATLVSDKEQLSMEVGSTTTIKLSTLPNSALNLEYDKTQLEVIQNGNILTVKAIAIGKSDIKLTAKAENYIENEKIIPVSVAKASLIITPAKKSITTTIDNDQVNVKVAISQPDAIVSVKIDNAIADVFFVDDELQIITAKEGKANITLTAEKDEYNSSTITIPLTIDSVAPVTSVSEQAQEVLSILNKERKDAGLKPLTYNSSAQKAADIRAKESVELFSHTRPNGSKWHTVLEETGITYTSAGENIASGYITPTEVMQGWMDSPGHRENILKTEFTKVTIGMYNDNGVPYWTQLFTN